MRPRSISPDSINGALVDAVNTSNVNAGHLAPSNQLHVVIAQGGLRIRRAFRVFYQANTNRVLSVFLGCHILQITQRIVRLHAVDVIDDVLAWGFPDKRIRNKSVDTMPTLLSVVGHHNDGVAKDIRLGLAYFDGLMVGGRTLDTTEIRNGIKVRQFSDRDRSPLLAVKGGAVWLWLFRQMRPRSTRANGGNRIERHVESLRQFAERFRACANVMHVRFGQLRLDIKRAWFASSHASILSDKVAA